MTITNESTTPLRGWPHADSCRPRPSDDTADSTQPSEASVNTKAVRKLADDLDAEFTQGRISNHNGRKAAAEIRLLIDRLEKAEKDAARLDWLEKHDKRYYNYDKISCIVGSGFSHGFISEGVNSTLRDAIDTAMEASK